MLLLKVKNKSPLAFFALRPHTSRTCSLTTLPHRLLDFYLPYVSTPHTSFSLFRYAERDLPRFSHDRQHFTFIGPHKNSPPTLWIASAPNAPARPLITGMTHPIIEYSWAHTNNHILFLQDNQGDENWHLHVVDITTGIVTDIISRPHVRVHSYVTSPHAPETVIIIMNARDRTLYDVYTYNISTGQLHITARNDGTVKSWHIDNQLKVRAKVCYNESGSFYLYVRATQRSKMAPCSYLASR